MDRRVKWLAAAAVAALAAGPASADHSWASYHWGLTGTNQRFDVLTALSRPHWNSLVADAVADWDGSDPDASGYTDYFNPVIVGPSNASARKCDPISGKVHVCSDSYGFRGWLGIATIWTSGGHIVQATTKLNDSYHDSGTYSSTSWRAAVACQEIGHDFGLGHQDEDFSTDATSSCMEYTSIPAGNETPDGHDYQQLQTIYAAHFNEGTGGGGGGGRPGNGKGPNKMDPFAFREVGQAPPSANPLVSDDWGSAVGFDAHGRPNVFVNEVRQGFRKITHVTWLPGFRPERHHMHDH